MIRHSAILRAASWIAPSAQREEWLAEWRGELCFVRGHSQGAATAFCLGAFRDALWLRRNNASPHPVPRLQSPASCLLLLALLAVVSGTLAFRLSTLDGVVFPEYGDPANVTVIAPEGRSASREPAVTAESYRSLASRTSDAFEAVAFYRPLTPPTASGRLSVALASASFAEVLRLPARGRAQLILSDRAWRSRYRADPSITGRLIEIGGRTAAVTAVLPRGLHTLPGGIEAWLIDEERSALSPGSMGFVIGRGARAQSDWRIRFVVPDSEGGRVAFESTKLPHGRPALALLFGLGIAVLILPSVTSLSLGEYPSGGRARQWVFLGLKLSLVVPVVFCGALTAGSLIAPGIYPQVCLIGYVIAFRWVLIDQRRRCPVCLRLLTHPARIGCSSRLLLDWYGTEFICARGHGLLHVPEIPVSSYGAQRWLELDSSWRSLFRGSNAPPA